LACAKRLVDAGYETVALESREFRAINPAAVSFSAAATLFSYREF